MQVGVWWGYISIFLVIINSGLVTLSSHSLKTRRGEDNSTCLSAAEIKELTQTVVPQTAMYIYCMLIYLNTKTMFLKQNKKTMIQKAVELKQ